MTVELCDDRVFGGTLKHDITKVPVAKPCPLRLYRDRAYATDSIRNINIICGQNARFFLKQALQTMGSCMVRVVRLPYKGAVLDRA